MGHRRRQREPVEVRLDRLEARHTSGLDATGQRWKVRAAPVGALVHARPGRKQTARRVALLEPSPDAVEPPCPVFGTCGGCQLQEMPLSRQRAEKQALVDRLVGDLDGVAVRPIAGAPDAYGYRNKLELSWGTRRFTPEGVDRDALPPTPSSLGLHPPGWYSKIVDLDGCALGTPAMNGVIHTVSAMQLTPAWDNQTHAGVWRHLVIRDSGSPEAPRVLVSLVTSSAADPDQVSRVGEAVSALPGVSGVIWVVTDSLADVATGALRQVLHGDPDLVFDLAGLHLRLPHDAFFQVNTAGAQVLLDRIADAAGAGGTLLDLYCGVGFIGLGLAHRFDRVIGVELHEGAIQCARDNAALNDVTGEWHAGPVEELLPTLELSGPLTVVVDPPRAGLHPRAARYLADFPARTLIYVACNPASLGRDRELLAQGGWRLVHLSTVDLFPQTQHVEAVALFQRPGWLETDYSAEP